MYLSSFHPPSLSYTTLVIPAWTITLAHSSQGYLVTYSVHPLTEGGIPIIALHSACDTNIGNTQINVFVMNYTNYMLTLPFLLSL